MKKENQRIVLTRRLLREALLTLLAERPLEKISVTALCATAGINRTTFYHHYNSPADLLAEYEAELAHELQQMVRETQDERETMVAACTCLYRHREALCVLFRCNVDRQLEAAIGSINQKLLAQADRMPAQYARDADAIALASTFIGSGAYYLIRRWLTEGLEKSPEEIATLIFAILREDRE